MAYFALLSSIGWTIFFYGILNSNTLVTILGVITHVISMITAEIIEDRFRNRIEKLEKELKEMKTNDKRNSL